MLPKEIVFKPLESLSIFLFMVFTIYCLENYSAITNLFWIKSDHNKENSHNIYIFLLFIIFKINILFKKYHIILIIYFACGVFISLGGEVPAKSQNKTNERKI